MVRKRRAQARRSRWFWVGWAASGPTRYATRPLRPIARPDPVERYPARRNARHQPTPRAGEHNVEPCRSMGGENPCSLVIDPHRPQGLARRDRDGTRTVLGYICEAFLRREQVQEGTASDA